MMITDRPMKIIARMHSSFPEKFGIPRQSGLADALIGRIVMEPEYRNIHAFKGLIEYSHIWLLWEFSEAVRDSWSPSVHPPRLGGNTKMGVFATRSPYRPNPIGLSSVKLIDIEDTEEGTVLVVSGADLMDGTPIYDIKPYIPYTDSHPDAKGGFADDVKDYALEVNFGCAVPKGFGSEKERALIQILSGDPRPSYQNDPERVYGMFFEGFDIHFKVCGGTLTVTDFTKMQKGAENL